MTIISEESFLKMLILFSCCSVSALNAPPKELSLFGYQLCVNKADKVHQPIEFPDGTVQWLPGKRFFKESGDPVCDKAVSLQIVICKTMKTIK